MTAFKRLAILFLNAALALNIYPVSRKFGRYRLVGSHDMACAQCTSRTDQLHKELWKSIAGPKTTIWACTHILLLVQNSPGISRTTSLGQLVSIATASVLTINTLLLMCFGRRVEKTLGFESLRYVQMLL